MKKDNPFSGSGLLTAAPEGGATATVKPAKSESDIGTIKHIEMGRRYGRSDDKTSKRAEITVQYGPDPKPPKKDEIKGACCHPIDEPERATFPVPIELARGLAIGDKIRISITKVG